MNAFFKNPLTPRTQKESAAQKLADHYTITDEQARIFRMYYMEKHDAEFIAAALNCSRVKIHKELATIRKMLDNIL